MKVFITGGTSGIGLELAKRYLKDGHDVGICGRNLNKLPKGISDEFIKLKTYQLSVTDKELLQKSIEDFSEGHLDLLIANAGRSHGSKTKDPDFDVARDILETNIFGVVNAFETGVKLMKNQKHGGQIVALASVAGFVGLPGASAYSASKSAVIKFCESLGLDLINQKISVTCICPGFIDTALTRQNDHDMPWMMSAEKGALKIQKAIEKKRALYIFPWQMKTVILFLNKIPRGLYRFLMKLPIANYSKE